MPSRSKANRPGRGTPRRAKPKRPSSGPPAPAAKLQRWIDLLAALLRRHYPATFEELVRDVPGYRRGQTKETRRRMFERDKDELRAFGIPIETIAIEGEIAAYQLSRRDFYLPYLQLLAEGRPSRPNTVSRFGYRALPTLAFEPDELGAIVEAGNRVRHLGDPALAADAESALRKLAVDLAVDLGAAEATVVPPRERPDPAVLAEIDEALARRKRLTFTYRSMAQGVTSTRTVEPFGLFFVGQHWYLAGRTPGEEVVKNYRVSRMRDAQVNRVKPGTPDYVVPGDFSLAAHARARQAWELGDGEALEAVVEFRGEDGATRAAARLGEPADDSSGEGAAEGAARRRRFRVRRPDAFVRWLLSFAGGAVPVSPPELVASYRALVAGTLALYTGAAAGVDGVAPRAGGGEPR
ncbi:MAG TPA: WYL domain-containing protein, partial [Gemmatimonadales bacterium]|nr:WYL domain-containing protein [Gemmatimonadales bacterium]